MKNDVMNFVQYQERKDFEQEKERHDIFQQIQTLRKDIKQFKDQVKNATPDHMLKVQQFSENLGQKVSIFKEKQMLVFEQMQEEADILYNDLMIFQDKSTKYETV